MRFKAIMIASNKKNYLLKAFSNTNFNFQAIPTQHNGYNTFDTGINLRNDLLRQLLCNINFYVAKNQLLIAIKQLRNKVMAAHGHIFFFLLIMVL